MTSDKSRNDYLEALGLVAWQYRENGPLAAVGSASIPDIESVSAADSDTTKARMAREAEHVGPAPIEPGAGPVFDSPSEADRSRERSSMVSSEHTAPSGERRDDGPSGLDWAGLEADLAQRDHRGATQPVFGVGARDADVLIVGEAPGANEDAQGVPFVGRAGKLLDHMLFAIGCSRATNVYITNICKFRPPDNRDPRPEEVAADWPILERQIDLMNPKLVVAVGRVAAQTLLDCKTPLGRMRGRLHQYPARELNVLVTYHPAYLLRSPGEKSKAWDDLKMIARHIGNWQT